MQIRLLQLAVLFICLSGCIDRHTNTPAFYVWKNKLNAEDADTAYLNTLGVPKIYARIFDVDNKGNGTFPTADYSPSSPYDRRRKQPLTYLQYAKGPLPKMPI